MVVQAFGGEGHWAREPTPAELRCMTYLGLAHGARGVRFRGGKKRRERFCPVPKAAYCMYE